MKHRKMKNIFFDDKLNVQIGSLLLFLFYGLKTICSIKQKRWGDTCYCQTVCKSWNVKGD